MVAERELLGRLVLALEAGDDVAAFLRGLGPTHFVNSSARAAYEELARAVDERRRITREELVSAIVNNHAIAPAAAGSYVNGLIADAPSQPHLAERVRRVREAARQREERGE